MKNILGLIIVLSCYTSLCLAACNQNGDITEGDNANCWTCGSNCTARLDTKGKLTVSGSGNMTNYSFTKKIENLSSADYLTTAPWKYQASKITSIDIQGISNLSAFAFRGLDKVTKITMDDNVIRNDQGTFQNMPSLESITLSANLQNVGHMLLAKDPKLKTLVVPASVTEFVNSNWRSGSGISKLYCTKEQIEICGSKATLYEKKGDLYYIYDEEGNVSEIYGGFSNFSENMYKIIDDRDKYTINDDGSVFILDNNGALRAKYSADGKLLAQYLCNSDGSINVYNKDGKLITIRGKRIYTIDEAVSITQNGNKNTFSIRYR